MQIFQIEAATDEEDEGETDESDYDDAEDVIEEEVIFFDNSPNCTPRLPDFATPRSFIPEGFDVDPDINHNELQVLYFNSRKNQFLTLRVLSPLLGAL